MRLKAADVISKYRILFAAEILILAALGLFLIFKKSYSFTLGAENLVITEAGFASGYLHESSGLVADIIVPSDSPADNLDLCIWQAPIPFGVYEAEVTYSAIFGGNSNDAPLLKIVTFDNSGDTSYFSDDIILAERLTKVTSRVYSAHGRDSMNAFFRLNGSGRIRVDSLTIKEYKLWRPLAFLSFVFAFAVIDSVLLFQKNADKSSRRTLISLFVLFILTSFPLFNTSILYGHDYSFHMYRVGSLAQELLRGNIPAKFLPGAYNGYGYIIDVLYSNLFMVPASVVHMLGAPLSFSYNFCLIYINALTIILAYYSFSKTFGEAKWGVLGSYLYTLSMYRLCDLYIRSDEGELFAMAFLPLAIYGFIRIYRSENRSFRDVLPLVLGITGIIQSHVLSTMFAAFFIFIFSIINLPKTLKKLPKLLFSVLLLLFINLFYLFPVATSFIGMGLKSSSEMSFDIYDAALTFSQIFDLKFIPGHSGKEVDMYFGTGLFIIIALIMLIGCLFVSIKMKTKNGAVKIGIESLVMALIASFISSRLFPWNVIGESTGILGMFKVVQFPWRFMEYAAVFYCFAAVAGFVLFFEAVENVKVSRFFAVLSVLGTSIVALIFITAYIKTYPRYLYRDTPIIANLDWAPAPEGLSIGGCIFDDLTSEDNSDIYRALTGESVMTEGALTYEVRTYEDSRKIYEIKNGYSDINVKLPVFAFDNIVVTDENGVKYLTGRSEDYCIVLPVPAGSENTYYVNYHIPALWRVIDIVSVISVLLTIIILGRKKTDVAKD